ncbi:hypothetical protein BDZ89DRAFT_296010 [Hymenopellis radicata]|nr:hypothetical protein BDZ89DRAFT_296010 [Hymenopellis radicata]
MTALPALANTQLDPTTANVVSAYNVCLTFQTWADARDDPSALIHARVLGYLILHTTARPHALVEVVNAIHSCGQDFHQLSRLGESFIDYFIRPCNTECFPSL